MTKSRTELMGTEKISRLILRFAGPAILTMLVSATYNLVDKIFLGQGIGEVGIAATTVAMPLMNILVAIATLVGAGGNALLAIRLGEGKSEQAEKILGNSVALVTIIAIVVSVIGLIFLEPLMQIFGSDAELMPSVIEYARIILIGTVFQCISTAICNYIRTEGNPTRAMLCSMSGMVVNIALDALFILVFGWGLWGAALATIIAQFVSAALVISYFAFEKKSTIRLRLGTLRLDGAISLKSVQLGFPTFIGTLLASIVNALLNNSLVYYAALEGGEISSAVAISAIGITTGIGSVFVMCIGGLQQAVQPIMGYNYGARKYQRLKSTVKLGCAFGLGFLLVGYVIIMCFTEQLVMIFGEVTDPASLEYIVWTMRTYNLLMPLIAITQVCTNYFTATGQALKATFLGMARQVFGLIPFMLIMPRFFGIKGIVSAFPVADFVVCTAVCILMFREWKKLNVLESELPPEALEQPAI